MNQSYSVQFKALSDSNRLLILQLLIKGDKCGCNLLDKLSIGQPTLSYHLKQLKNAGLIMAKKDGVFNKHHVNLSKIDELIEYLHKLKTTSKSCAIEK